MLFYNTCQQKTYLFILRNFVIILFILDHLVSLSFTHHDFAPDPWTWPSDNLPSCFLVKIHKIITIIIHHRKLHITLTISEWFWKCKIHFFHVFWLTENFEFLHLFVVWIPNGNICRSHSLFRKISAIHLNNRFLRLLFDFYFYKTRRHFTYIFSFRVLNALCQSIKINLSVWIRTQCLPLTIAIRNIPSYK